MEYKERLTTERLLLRPFASDDFAAVHSWASNPANVRYMAWGPNTEDDTRWFLSQTKPGKDFAVVLSEIDTVISSCGIYPDDANLGTVSDEAYRSGLSAELGWILHIDHWKKGCGAELCGELIRYGFEDLNLRRIKAPCAAANYGSYRIMERNGMRREALHVKGFWARVDKEWVDEAVYAILKDEYETKI
jgi:RimJ/RimL family protein N-acetyltransferase